MNTLVKLDIELYKRVSDDIATEEVIVTEKQIEHINKRHQDAYEKYGQYIPEVILNPDYIVESPRYATAIVMKEMQIEDGAKLKLVLRINTSSDPDGYKNSVITFMRIRAQDWNRILRNKNILYTRQRTE